MTLFSAWPHIFRHRPTQRHCTSRTAGSLPLPYTIGNRLESSELIFTHWVIRTPWTPMNEEWIAQRRRSLVLRSADVWTSFWARLLGFGQPNEGLYCPGYTDSVRGCKPCTCQLIGLTFSALFQTRCSPFGWNGRHDEKPYPNPAKSTIADSGSGLHSVNKLKAVDRQGKIVTRPIF